MQNRLNKQQNVTITTTQETNEQLNAARESTTPLVPISWEVGTGLVYVTFDQIQGEIMEMDEYLTRYKNKDTSCGNQDNENSKGSYHLDFLSMTGGADYTNAKGCNVDNDTDTTESYDVPPINNDIKQQVDELFKQSAMSNKCFVPVERLTDDIICAHQPSRRPPSIDPYSSLEDIGSGKDNTTPTSDSNKNKDTNEQKTCYYMWTRKSKTIRHSAKPLRENRNKLNYADLFKNDSESDRGRTKSKKTPKPVPSAPSNDRIAAQGAKNKPPQRHHPVPLLAPNKRFHRKDPSSTKPLTRSKALHALDKVETLDPHAPLPTPPDNNQQPPKGVFKTTKHGIVKHKNTCYFLCPVCGIHKSTTSKLNVHYRNRHKPLTCTKCSMVFNIPSALARHRYTHQKPRHFCTQCGKGYYFLGELSQHSLIHRKICTHFCNFGNCTKSYLSNADLLKHVRTHTPKEMQCTKCDYKSKDKKLLLSHMKVHEDTLRYQCKNCGQSFWHRNQIC